MHYFLSKKSKNLLVGVHPDLVAVINRAIEITPYDFGVSRGVGTIEQQAEFVKTGKSTTMHSEHIPGADGYSHAVDLYVLVDGKSNWEYKYFRKLIQAVFTAAIELGVQVEAGGLWRDFIDSPHIQLNDKYYGGV